MKKRKSDVRFNLISQIERAMFLRHSIQYTGGSELACTLTDIHNRDLQNITSAIQKARDDISYSSVYASVCCPFDEQMYNRVSARIAEIGIADYCVVIGIGGSSMGFRAVYEALQDVARIPINRVYVLETVDSAAVINTLRVLEKLLIQKVAVHVCIVSKSGTTVETIALWSIIQEVLKKHDPEKWTQQVTIITDDGSALATYAHEQRIAMLTIPAAVGGRYSVFSAAGLFPLALCGIPIQELMSGARDAIDGTAGGDRLRNDIPLQHAIALLSAYQKRYEVHDTFIFSTRLHALGLWYRQLAAESLGKKRLSDKQIVSMIPTVSIGSTDLHAIGQLYLSGANNFWTTFITVRETTTVSTSGSALIPGIQNRPLTDIMDAIVHGTMQAYHEQHVPFTHMYLSNHTPYTIGYLMQSYMLAIMYAGALLDVSPFDQPDVERYKKNVRKQLSNR